jgi:hypothetical protein
MRTTVRTAVTWSLAAGAVGSVVLTAPAAFADSTTPTPTSSPAATCGSLPAWVQGQPGHLHARAATGDYLWHDSSGWHLRVTHPTKQKKVFTGVITASSPITFARVKDEARDKVTLSADKTKLAFRFVNYGGIDGVDFTDQCATTTKFALAIAGHKATRNQVYVGAHSARPRAVPFTISRRSSPAAA